MYKFKDKYNLGYPFYHIHPYKQEVVKEMIRAIKGDIKYIIVFGSAVTPYCTQYSDLDICVIGNYIGRDRKVSVGSVDIVNYRSIDELCRLAKQDRFSLENEIIENGVLVYENGASETG